MLDSHGALAIAELVFFAPALCIALFVVLRHGFSRQQGWFYLVLLSLLRIVGYSCLLYAENNNDPSTGLLEAYFICTSIGTAPLLLAWMGFLMRINQGMVWKGVSLNAFRPLHIISLVALVIAIIGGSDEGGASVDSSDYTTGRALRRAAALIWLLMYFALGAIALWTLHHRSHVMPMERALLNVCVIVLPFILVRMLYTVITAFAGSGSVFYFRAINVWIEAFMQFLMEAIVVACFVTAGLMTPQAPKREPTDADKAEQGRARGGRRVGRRVGGRAAGRVGARFEGLRAQQAAPQAVPQAAPQTAPQQSRTQYQQPGSDRQTEYQPAPRLGDYRPSRLIRNAIQGGR